mmetsp:Transcript_125237/g.227139  ORF Transcript_125237/g.227139 Transcript_125237/m.227139 type:complete len:94 (-) Transcript_125237:263-544(-)
MVWMPDHLWRAQKKGKGKGGGGWGGAGSWAGPSPMDAMMNQMMMMPMMIHRVSYWVRLEEFNSQQRPFQGSRIASENLQGSPGCVSLVVIARP